jgi:hypothetical protein
LAVVILVAEVVTAARMIGIGKQIVAGKIKEQTNVRALE